MNKTAHYMISKFAGTCNRCGDRVEAGEAIYWLSRGKIECNDCTGGAAFNAVMGNPASIPANQPKPAATNLTGDKWAAAMSWDSSAPSAGASIAATASAEKPAKPRKAKSAPKPAPAKPVPVVASQPPTDAEKKVIDARMIAAGHTTPETAPAMSPDGYGPQSRDDTPAAKTEIERDAVSALVCDQLALLVNALDSATIEQRKTISAYAETFAADSVVPSRARIWTALSIAAVS